MRILRIVLACWAMVLVTGCASIVNGQNQSLSVTARQNSADVVGAECQLSNDKGTWYIKTPGSTTVHRSYADLVVRCDKPGMQPGIINAKSSTKGMAFGNLLFGGVIGAGVDMSTGAAYDYPETISVQMGQSGVAAPSADGAADGTQPHSVPAQPISSPEPAASALPSNSGNVKTSSTGEDAVH